MKGMNSEFLRILVRSLGDLQTEVIRGTVQAVDFADQSVDADHARAVVAAKGESDPAQASTPGGDDAS